MGAKFNALIPLREEGTENGTVTVDLSEVNFQIRELLKRKGCKNGPVIKTQEAHVDDVELVSDSNLFRFNAFSILLVGKEIMAPSSIGSHFNPTFEGLVESMVKLDKDGLQSRRHSYVSFKESDVPKKIKPSGISDSVELGKGHSASKGRGSGEKGGVVRSNRVISKTIQDRGGRFKNSCIVRVFLYQTP
ncbi:hypothetical protein Goshw_023889 [Gossypium schwendimanii]|uniref:Uncharacterized protein n=1 Tax=Gossypium schwendimanii TaxID=34291 RepID=A0A7J9KU17_GOSSC|nr:hypothetical protein [Gossypium schwendimanii]